MHIYQYLHVFAFCTNCRTVYNSNYMYMYMYMYCVQLQCMHTMTINHMIIRLLPLVGLLRVFL